MPAIQRPLEDLTVLDLTLALAGPFATLILAGLGARVIKIENPGVGDHARTNSPYMGPSGIHLRKEGPEDISLAVLNRMRNKLGVTLNLKKPEGREVFVDLLKKADAVVDNFSYGTLDRLGLGYEFGRTINPRVVYCSINGYGPEDGGKIGSNKAMDTIIQALSGAMLISGNASDPPIRFGIPVADMVTPMFGIIGLLAALHQAKRTGVGQAVDVSMLGALTALVASEPHDALAKCGVPVRTGNSVPRLAPFGIFKAKDGYVSICAPNDPMAHALFNAMAQPSLQSDARFEKRDARVMHVDQLDAIINQWMGTLTVGETMELLNTHQVPSAPVRGPIEAVQDPRVLSRGDIVPLTHPKYGAVDQVYGMGMPVHFSNAYSGFDQAAPELGQHNQDVYGGLLGYSQEKLAALRAAGVI